MNDFIHWSGEGRPDLADDVMVEVKFDQGPPKTELDLVCTWRWENMHGARNIIAYRVVDEIEKDIKAAIADRAKDIVNGARRSAYGTPEDNFERIARFWQAYFENTGRGELKITARDVSPMMRLMKEARLAETPDHLDSFIDLVGYTLTGAEVNGVKATDFS